jgi:hypothetical protein
MGFHIAQNTPSVPVPTCLLASESWVQGGVDGGIDDHDGFGCFQSL